MKILWQICLTVLFSLPLVGLVTAQSTASEAKTINVDIPVLLQQVRDHQQVVEEMKEKYTCVETMTTRQPNAKGELRDEETLTYEVTFYKGERIRRLVARNGKPLAAKEEAKITRAITKQIRSIDERLPELERKRQAAKERGEEEDDLGISYMLRTSRFRHPRSEYLRGRAVIVFDFEPNPDYQPRTSFEKKEHRLQFAGAMWIDAADLQVARVEALLVKGLKLGGGLVGALKPGANFVLEQERINHEVWLPTYEEVNYAMRLMFLNAKVHTLTRFSHYQRFAVEAEKEKIKLPENGTTPIVEFPPLKQPHGEGK